MGPGQRVSAIVSHRALTPVAHHCPSKLSLYRDHGFQPPNWVLWSDKGHFKKWIKKYIHMKTGKWPGSLHLTTSFHRKEQCSGSRAVPAVLGLRTIPTTGDGAVKPQG